MARSERSLPIFVVLIFGAAAATFVPSFYGAAVQDFDSARVFFYSGLLFAIAAGLLWLAVAPTAARGTERRYLVALLLAYVWLPALLSVPMLQLRADLGVVDVYFDMVSAMTTTGAVVFAPDRLSDTAHLWRATVGWLGGALIWLSALVVLAPLNLGGFEVTSEAEPDTLAGGPAGRAGGAPGRMYRNVMALMPIYLGLTVVLAVALTLAGERPLHALIHAMSTLSTSGISAVGGPMDGSSGVMGEVLILFFFIFALTRRSFLSGVQRRWGAAMAQDREFRLGVILIGVLTLAVFLRNWIGDHGSGGAVDWGQALSALWGGAFTIASFLTTTGFVSQGWAEAAAWSGLAPPGLVLLGLVLIGGGVATTAGGLKLLRVYALYKHGSRETDRLVHPHAVAGAGRMGQRIRQDGAYIAWIVLMLLLVSLGAVMLALTATGVRFEDALVFAVAAISTTGPLVEVAGQAPLSYADLSDPAKMVLGLAMIVGRLETLVFLAVFTPSFWRG